MTEKHHERDWITAVFGREQSAQNIARKSWAGILHSVLLHPGLKDPEYIKGIKKTLARNMIEEDIEIISKAHASQEEHSL